MTITKPLTRESALSIAREDAERVYRNLDRFFVTATQSQDVWHVDYELEDGEFVCGGGPHYIIDSQTGEITWKRYDQ